MSIQFPNIPNGPSRSTRFAAVNLDAKAEVKDFPKVIGMLAEDDKPRTDFLKACLAKLGLKVNTEQVTVPSLSRLHLTSLQPSGTSKVLSALEDIITIEDGGEYIKDENDTFHLEKPSMWSLGSLGAALLDESKKETDQDGDGEDRILDYNTIVKRLVVHDKEYPLSKETPYFNHHAYFANLQHYQSVSKDINKDFGGNLLYGEVVTSTNTLLEK